MSNEIPVKIKKFRENAVIPFYSTEGSVCVDLVAAHIEKIDEDKVTVYFGFGVEIPEGYKITIQPRSSFTHKNWVLQNSPGQIDTDYRGELMAKFQAFPSDVEILDTELVKQVMGIEEDDLEEDSDLLDEYQGVLIYPEFIYKVGDKVVQASIDKVYKMKFEVVDSLNKTERGEGGFGSTGNN